MRAVIALGLLIAPMARAYETDQLTYRDQPPADATPIANDLLQHLLAQAVDHTNQRTQCDASPKRTYRVLARAVHRRTSASRMDWERGLLRAPGFSRYSRALEQSEAERHDFADRSDLYGSVRVRDSFILREVGTSSTFQIGGVLLGSDKADHFLDEGFAYLKASRWGARPDRAIRRGTRTERTVYGLWTSKTFSYGDLRANYDGYLFYRDLLDGQFAIGDDGCVVAQPFDWAARVSWEYDEVLNPSVWTPAVDAAVHLHLEQNREAYCAALDRWAPDGFAAVRAAHPLGPAPYADDTAPPRVDPIDLDALCAAR